MDDTFADDIFADPSPLAGVEHDPAPPPFQPPPQDEWEEESAPRPKRLRFDSRLTSGGGGGGGGAAAACMPPPPPRMPSSHQRPHQPRHQPNRAAVDAQLHQVAEAAKATAKAASKAAAAKLSGGLGGSRLSAPPLPAGLSGALGGGGGSGISPGFRSSPPSSSTRLDGIPSPLQAQIRQVEEREWKQLSALHSSLALVASGAAARRAEGCAAQLSAASTQVSRAGDAAASTLASTGAQQPQRRLEVVASFTALRERTAAIEQRHSDEERTRERLAAVVEQSLTALEGTRKRSLASLQAASSAIVTDLQASIASINQAHTQACKHRKKSKLGELQPMIDALMKKWA